MTSGPTWDGSGATPVDGISVGPVEDGVGVGAVHDGGGAALRGRLRPRRVIVGHRALRRSRGITSVVPEPADQAGQSKRKGSRGGLPVSYDVADDKQRNVVEGSFSRLKNWRGLASRYNKHALTYRSGVVLAACRVALR